jgi:gliding motility-associated-like protein
MIIRVLLFFALSLLFSAPIFGSHLLGGNITWTCLGGNNYQVTLTYYRDCLGNNGNDPAAENVSFIPLAGCSTPFSSDLDFVSTTEISDLCATELPNSSCSGGINPGTQQVVYQGNVVLAAGCTWRVVYNDQDWNLLFLNTSGGLVDAFIHAEINTTACSNSSAIVSTVVAPQVPYICYNTGYSHTININNPSGYTLSYSLVNTYTTGANISANPVGVPGYSTPSGVSLVGNVLNITNANAANGFPFFGSYVFTVEVTMMNGATLVGVVNETFVVIVRNCAPTVTTISTPVVQTVGNETTLDNASTVSICSGDSLAFSIEATNPDLFRSIGLTYTVAPPLPALNMTTVAFNPVVGNFSIDNTDGLAGNYTVTITATDDACPNPDSDVAVVNVIIHPNINVNFTDTIVCDNVNTMITASGLSNVANYDWSIISGDMTPTPADGVASQLVSPDSTTVYQVTGIGVPAQCITSQQITVSVSLHNLSVAAAGETCNNTNGSIDIGILGNGSGNYGYNWTGAGIVQGVQDQTNLNGGNYSVTVTDLTYGCSITENIALSDSPAPTATFTGSTTVCENGIANATLDFTAGQGPFNFTISPAVVPILDMTGVSDPYVFPIQMGVASGNFNYTITSITDATGCSAVTNYPITISVRPTIIGTFIQPAPLCSGDPLCLQVDYSAVGGLYNLTYNSGGASTTISVLDNGCVNIGTGLTTTTIFDIDTVAYTTAPACPSSDGASGPTTVIVNPLPTMNLSGGSMTCPGATDQLTLTPLTGTGPWTVVITEAGVPLAPIIVPAGSPTFNFNVTPAATGTTQYCIQSVEDINCLNANNSNLNQCTTSTAVTASTATLTGGTTICEGGQTTLVLTQTAGTGPFDFVITPAIALLNTTNVTSPYNIVVSPSSTTTYTVTSITDNLNCPTTVNISQTVTVLPLVTTTIQPVLPLCAGDPLSITVDHSAAGSYFIQYSVNGDPPVTTPAAVADGGTISITPAPSTNATIDIESVFYGGANACPSGDAANGGVAVTVNALPTGTLSGGSTICDGGNDDLTLTLTGVGPWTIGYTLNNIAQPPLVVAASPFTWNVSPVGTGNFNYCITSVQDQNCLNGTNSGANSCTTVIVRAYPTLCAYSVDNTDLCEGACGTLTVTVCEAGLWTMQGEQLPDNAMPNSFIGQGSALLPGVPFTYSICPNITTDYVLTQIYFDGAPQCATVLNDTITVNVNGVISVAAPDTICNNIGTSYTLQYTVSGGEQPFDELPGGIGGVFAADVFTSSPIPSGQGANFTFSDVNDCNSVLMTMNPYACPVLTNAGTMSNTLLQFCNNGNANGTHNNDGFLDGNDQQAWLLVTDPANASTTIVQTNCVAPQFGFIAALMTYSTTYYIVSVVGDDFGDGNCVNLTAPNVMFSNGQPVIWYANPTATLSTQDNTVCTGECVTMEVALTGQGPWVGTYDYNGSAFNLPLIPAGTVSPFTWCTSNAGDYQLLSIQSGPLTCSGVAQGNVTVFVNPLPAATWSGSAETCAGENHCFDITFTAGTGPWDVEVDVPVGANAIINDVNSPYAYCAGVQGGYDIVWIRDANDCVNTANLAPVILTVNGLPTAAWSLSDTSYCAGTTVPVSAIMTGETPYTVYVTEPGGVNEIPALWNGGLLQLDEPGAFVLDSIVDNNGCVGIMNETVVLTEVSLPVIDAGPDLEVCSGIDIVIGTAGIGAQTYLWSPATGLLPGQSVTATPTVNIISAGGTEVHVYTVEVTNDICVLQDDMELTVYAPPAVSITSTLDSICYGAATDLTANNGPGYSWLWNANPGIVGADNTQTIGVAPLTTDTFTVVISQLWNTAVCRDSVDYTIYVGDSLVVEEDFTEQLCFGACNGSIDLSTTGGFLPYSYTINSDLGSDLTIDLCPNTYGYEIEDAIGCLVSGQIIIAEREPEFIDSIVVTQPVCSYDTGSIEVFDNGTSINITSDCGVNETVFGTYALFDGLVSPCSDTITAVFQVDANAFCTSQVVIEILSISTDIQLNPLWTSDQLCYNDQVCFEASPAGGTGNPDVQWFNCDQLDPGCFVSTDNPFCFNLQTDSTLYGVAIDGLGCYSDTVMMAATLFPGIDINLSGGLDTLFLCEYDTLTISAGVSGGNGFIEVDWYNVINDASPLAQNQLDFEVHPFFETTYYAIAEDNCSEPVSDTITVVVYDTPEVYFETDTIGGCFPVTINFYDLTTVNPGINFDCTWEFGNGAELNVCADTTEYTYPGFGEFYPTLTVTTENDCEASYTSDAAVEVYGFPEMDFTWNPQPVTVLEHVIEFTNLTQGAESYLWNFYGLATSVSRNPVHDISEPIDMGVYPVCLIATTEHGCVDTLCQDILVESILGVFVPNAFTPDGDGINDVFQPIVSGVKPESYKFWVFNKWGDLMFYSDQMGKAWTGGTHGGEFYVQQDTYVWRIECEAMQDGRIEVFEGHVNILR